MNRKGNKTAVEPLYSADDVHALGDYLKKEDAEREQPAYMIWLLCVNGGFRIGDILKLRIAAVCGKGKKVKEHLLLREEKRDKVIQRKLPDEVRKRLQGYVNGLDWEKVKYQTYLFESPRNPGKPYSYVWMNARLKEAAAVCGIDQPVTTHTMRKTFAYHYYVNNKDDKSVFATERECLEYLSSEILKHGSVAETLRYIGINQDKIDRTTSKVTFI